LVISATAAFDSTSMIAAICVLKETVLDIVLQIKSLLLYKNESVVLVPLGNVYNRIVSTTVQLIETGKPHCLVKKEVWKDG
jgi:hypothetical protein